MKTIILALGLFMLLSSFVFSQGKGGGMNSEKREKIKAQKVAFLTSKLDLTSDEAQLFWPVYNEYQKKVEEISVEQRKMMKDTKNNLASLSDKEIETITDKFVDFQLAEANLLKEYHLKFKKVLTKPKLLKLYRSEHQFKKQLLKDMRDRHEGGGRGKPDDND